MSSLKDEVKSQLLTGKANAIKGKYLAQRLGMKDTRSIRLAIRELIADGVPVIGSMHPPYGYYIAENIQECLVYMGQLRSYLIESALRRRDIKKAAERYFTGQSVMFGKNIY